MCFNYYVMFYRYNVYVFQVPPCNMSPMVYESILEQTTGLLNNYNSEHSLYDLIYIVSKILQLL